MKGGIVTVTWSHWKVGLWFYRSLHSNVHILYCFRDTARFLSKVARFPPPHLHLTSHYDWSDQSFTTIRSLVWVHRLPSSVELHWSMVTNNSTNHQLARATTLGTSHISASEHWNEYNVNYYALVISFKSFLFQRMHRFAYIGPIAAQQWVEAQCCDRDGDKLEQDLIRRWDRDRELVYDDIVHVHPPYA